MLFRSGYREYGPREVDQLRQVKLLRKLGVPLEEIRKMQSGTHTVGDGMRRHLVTLERDKKNLEQSIQLCRTLSDRDERLDDLDAAALLEQMDRQIDRARRGLPASMILKNNSINDPQIINKISEASCAGVRVDMIVRGICCIKAGVPGKTENVHIRSIVGRYLEHSRIYCFGEGEDMTIYIASGDFLTRNTERRVEVGVRVDDREIAKKLRGILDLQLRDTVNAREMQPDGIYTRVKPKQGEPPVDSQMAMYGYFQHA